jgi:hypothetical protein
MSGITGLDAQWRTSSTAGACCPLQGREGAGDGLIEGESSRLRTTHVVETSGLPVKMSKDLSRAEPEFARGIKSDGRKRTIRDDPLGEDFENVLVVDQ